MNNEQCNHAKVAPQTLIVELPDSQAGSGRHKCVTCAYDTGYYIAVSNQQSYTTYCQQYVSNLEQCKHGNWAPTHILQNLQRNQGGTGRHKCTNCAFKMGYEAVQTTIVLTSTSIPTLQKTEATKSTRSYIKTSTNASRKEVNYLQREAYNRSLGLAGELAVMAYEQEKLRKTKVKKTARHISKELGDNEGYDILSFDENGNELFIEVKTTRLPISHHFFISENELQFAKNNLSQYRLYRVYDFNPQKLQGKYYSLHGDIMMQHTMEPIVYRVTP